LTTETADFRTLTMEIQALYSLIGKTVGRAMHERLAQSGQDITPIQFRVLHIVHHQPHTLSELSKLFVLDPSTLVPIIDGLEARGLVERRKDPADRRRVPVVLTDAGEALIANLTVARDDHVLHVALKSLGTERTIQLRDLLRAVLESLPEGETAYCGVQDQLQRFQTIHGATSSTSAP